MVNLSAQKPAIPEYAEFYHGYVSLVGEGPITDILRLQLDSAVAFFREIPEDMASFRYMEGKWSISQVLGHLIDTERIMAFRALSFARGDTDEIPGMDQVRYASNARHDDCKFSSLIEEFEAQRRANVLFFQHLPEDTWTNEGVASGHKVSVRALAYIIAGHELHHTNVLLERYLQKN